MTKSFFLFIIILSFSFSSVFHFLRLMFEWNMLVGKWDIPGWISGINILFGIFMVYWSINIIRSNQKKK